MPAAERVIQGLLAPLELCGRVFMVPLDRTSRFLIKLSSQKVYFQKPRTEFLRLRYESARMSYSRIPFAPQLRVTCTVIGSLEYFSIKREQNLIKLFRVAVNNTLVRRKMAYAQTPWERKHKSAAIYAARVSPTSSGSA
jgi:hypothetical protein